MRKHLGDPSDHGQPGSYQLARWVSTENALILTGLAENTSYKPGTNPNFFCCPLLVRVSGTQFSWLERLPVTQGSRFPYELEVYGAGDGN